MLEPLHFTQRGISRSDPHMAHFAIRGGRVTSHNGILAFSAPLSLSFDAAPAAVPFIRALDACEETVSLTKESEFKLIVRSGSFRASVPCVALNTIPVTHPEGTTVKIQGIKAAFSSLKKFICSDENRPGVCSILLNGESAYATNNIIIAQYWLGTSFPFIANVPVQAVEEVCRVKEEPSTIQMCSSSITFHYEDGRWFKSQLRTEEWPNVAAILNQAQGNLVPVAKEFKDACAKLAKYEGKNQGQTFFRGTDVATAREDADTGIATVTVAAPEKGCYWTSYLNDVLEVAEKADFSKYPNPIPFVGERVRGVVVGIREQ